MKIFQFLFLSSMMLLTFSCEKETLSSEINQSQELEDRNANWCDGGGQVIILDYYFETTLSGECCFHFKPRAAVMNEEFTITTSSYWSGGPPIGTEFGPATVNPLTGWAVICFTPQQGGFIIETGSNFCQWFQNGC